MEDEEERRNICRGIKDQAPGSRLIAKSTRKEGKFRVFDGLVRARRPVGSFQPVPEILGADLNNNLITPWSRVGGNRLFDPLLGNNNRGAAARAREIIYSRRRRPGAPPRPEARSAAPSARAAASL